MEWKRPSQCSDGSCVEVKIGTNLVQLRNSKFAEISLFFTPEEWVAFIQGAKLGEFDLEQP